jgi:FkbM family methyltransferase
MIFAARDHYERELTYLHHFVEPGTVVVDGGANCGIYTTVAARLVGPSGRVLSFEPGTEAFSVLTKNIELNHLTNVRAHRAALSDRDGRARLYHLGRGPISFSIGRPKSTAVKSEEVVTRSLDDVFREEGIDRVGLIKLDIEGAEELVLRGAGQNIARSRPTIIFEVNAGAARQLGLHPYGAWELLRSWGYRFFSLTGCADLRELEKPPTADAIENVIAVHDRRWRR